MHGKRPPRMEAGRAVAVDHVRLAHEESGTTLDSVDRSHEHRQGGDENGPLAALVAGAVGFFMVMMLGDSIEPLLRFLAVVVIVAGVAATVGWLLGPVGLGITSAGGVVGAGVRSLRRAP